MGGGKGQNKPFHSALGLLNLLEVVGFPFWFHTSWHPFFVAAPIFLSKLTICSNKNVSDLF